ncbi:MAG: hypothetical protein ABIS06_16635 [Vicinamibacterales bacterium]
MRSSVLRVCSVLLLLSGSGCGGGPKPIHTSPEESRPHVTWEIRAGGEFGGEDFICGSLKPDALCTLPASKPSVWTFVAIYIDLHSPTGPTHYVGTWRAPFLDGWTDASYREVDDSVKTGEKPHQLTVSGIVTRQPGRYSFSVTLKAVQDGTPASTPISLNIPVTVFATGSVPGITRPSAKARPIRWQR